jgi:Ca2+-binding RTX toxin-like protein
VAVLAFPAVPAAAATCRFDPVGNAVFVSVGLESATIVQQGGLIGVVDSIGTHGCYDGGGDDQASVGNTDAVHVVSDGNVQIDPLSGPFAPGLTPESSGVSEIEFDIAFTSPAVLTIDGVTDANDIVVGSKGVNVDGDDDADVTFVNAARVVVLGGPGDDELSGLGGSGTGAAASVPLELWGSSGDDVLDGGSGADLLVGGAGSDDLDGHNGNDTLYALDPNPGVVDDPSVSDTIDGGRGNDEIFGGPGQDILRGSDGDDLIHAADGRADKVNGGQGFDTAEIDPGLDVVVGVELPPSP